MQKFRNYWFSMVNIKIIFCSTHTHTHTTHWIWSDQVSRNLATLYGYPQLITYIYLMWSWYASTRIHMHAYTNTLNVCLWFWAENIQTHYYSITTYAVIDAAGNEEVENWRQANEKEHVPKCITVCVVWYLHIQYTYSAYIIKLKRH